MAVVECIELAKGRDGDFEARSRARRYTRRFRVRTSDGLDGPAVVQAYLSLPALYSTYTSGNDADTAALVESVRVTGVGFKLWEAEVTYSTITPDSGQNAENPLDRNPVVRWSSQSYQVPVVRDVNGRSILNSAGDPFDPPIEREEKRPLLSVERFEMLYSPALAQEYQYAINSDTFVGALAGYARCNAIDGDRHYEKNFYCWRVKYEFEFRREGFAAQPLDQGFRYLSSGVAIQAKDAQGSFANSPVLLNGAGGLLSAAETSLVGNVTIGQNPILVDDTSNFPTVPYVIRIDSEEMLVTAAAASGSDFSLTVTRAYNGTSQATHSNGAAVTMQPHYHSFPIHKSLPFSALGIIV